MEQEFILYEKMRQGVLITMNRPDQLNALNEQMRVELDQAFTEAEADPEIRAIVLTGAGRAFCSGADMGRERAQTSWPSGVPEGMTVGEHIASWRNRDAIGSKRLQRMWQLNKPVIGAVNGWAMGWGSWFAICTHMTYASERAVFAQPEVRQISNTHFMWTLLAGFKNALRYGLTGDHIDAWEAKRLGLVNDVVPHDDLIDTCFELVERIALVSPDSVAINLAIATRGLDLMGLNNAWALNAELSGMVHSSVREEWRRPLEDAAHERGVKGYVGVRDAPFQPEPFGPRSTPADPKEEKPI